MKKSKKIIIGISVILVVILITYLLYVNFYKNNDFDMSIEDEVNELINIQDYTEEEMNAFLGEAKVLNESDNKDNIIIVTSKDNIEDKNAVNIVKAPNNQYFIEYATDEEKENALNKFNADETIFAATENIVYELEENEIENSTYNSWGIEATGLNTAIDIANGKNLNEVVVAIIDSGLDTELFNQNYTNKIKDYYNAFDSSEMYDTNGHGTHIAGTIAEGTPDNVKILPIKVTNSKLFYTTELISALNYVISDKKADVLNLSYSSPKYDASMYVLYSAADKLNITMVAAAGNDSLYTTRYPAGYDNTISVSSVDNKMNLSDFSNYSDTVTFSAPGTSIESINGLMSGTSMATPHVVSAVAILKSYNIDYTTENITDVLNYYSTDLGDVGKDSKFGYGFLSMNNIEYCEIDSCIDALTYFNDNPIMEYDRADIVKIEIIPETIIEPEVRFYSITDLYQVEVKAFIDDTTYYIEKLVNLPNVEITGYDPYETSLQNITAVYNGLSVEFDVTWDILSIVKRGWDYIEFIRETGNYITIAGIESFADSSEIETVVVPNMIKGLPVENIGNYNYDIGTGNFSPVKANMGTIKNIILSDGILKVDDYSFQDNKSIVSIKSLATSIEVGTMAFQNASNLETFDGNIDIVGSNAFENCVSLKNIYLANTMDSIPNYSFKNTPFLEQIVIPDSVSSIGEESFYNSNLKNIVIGARVSNIGPNAFLSIENIQTISVNLENTVYDSRDNSNAIIETSTNKLVLGSINTIIPSSIKIIGENAFYNYSMFGIFVIPEGVEVVEENALVGNKTLSQIVLPRSLSSFHSSNITEQRDIIFRFYRDTYAYFQIQNYSGSFVSIDPYKVEIIATKTNYIPYDIVLENDYSVKLSYASFGITEKVTEIKNNYSVSIKYPEGRDSFRIGDTKYVLTITNDINYVIEQDVNITVTESSQNYTINFDSNTGTGVMSSIEVPVGNNVILPENKYVKGDLYEFVNWNTKADGTGVSYENSSEFSSLSESETVTLYAQWRGVEKVLRFDAAGGTVFPTEKTYRYDEPFQELPIPSRAGYGFDGWKQNNVEIDTYTIFDNLSEPIASWKENAHTIIYDANGGVHKSSIKPLGLNIMSASLAVTTELDVKSNIYDREGYIFKEWNTKADGTGKSYNYDEFSVDILVNITTDVFRLYAIWEEEIPFVINKYDVDSDNDFIKSINHGTSVEDFKLNISLSSNYTIDVDYKTVKGVNVVYTGGKTRIYKNGILHTEFTNIIKGDVNGDGEIGIADIAKTYQHFKKTKTIAENYYIEAGKVTGNSNIGIGDIAKMYQYFKGIISDL